QGCCVLLPSSGPARDLLSFPTRRSSDLASHLVVPSPRCECISRRGAGFPAGRQPPVPPVRPLCGVSGRVRFGDRGEHGRDPLGVDRKSTRLNSSHVKISYAVFCLKKKTH